MGEEHFAAYVSVVGVGTGVGAGGAVGEAVGAAVASAGAAAMLPKSFVAP